MRDRRAHAHAFFVTTCFKAKAQALYEKLDVEGWTKNGRKGDALERLLLAAG